MAGDNHCRIRSFIADTFEIDGVFDETTELVRSEIIDSYGIVDVIDFIEEAFSISFPDEEITPENFRTVMAIADCVARIKAVT